jgi:hypothetical protein
MVLPLVLWSAWSLAESSRLSTAADLETKGDYQGAVDANEQHIEDLVQANGGYDITLFEPLLAKGRNLVAMAEYEDATQALQQAQHIARRNHGVYSMLQIEAIDLLTDMALQKGQPMQADTQQKLSFYISERFHGKESLDMLPAAYKLIDWYLETGQYTAVIDKTKEILANQQDTENAHHPSLIRAHILLAKARRLQGVCCSEKSLASVLDILAENPGLPSDLASQAYYELADALLISRKTTAAAEYYALASRTENEDTQPQLIAMSKILDPARQNRLAMYRVENSLLGGSQTVRMTKNEQLSAREQKPQQFLVPLTHRQHNLRIIDNMDSLGEREDTLDVIGTPFQFYLEQLRFMLPVAMRKPSEMAELEIMLKFAVEADGRVRNVEIISSNAPLKLNKLMREVLSKTRYRPALKQGVPVRKDQVTVTQLFPQDFGDAMNSPDNTDS